ncbi:hypothetical protein ATZ36_12690 [Candidatus Endomicrobiellum trichonymphae]|uniref:Uncharacterized protein n=1 Tax=Endomicrobium trichonymphae TaxID=1408204 RepID=A0A1E5IPE6_ENDTX|nr:hypothetical protein ATZ36_12690 [Candidatus Endomicrobium trichonymphae]
MIINFFFFIHITCAARNYGICNSERKIFHVGVMCKMRNNLVELIYKQRTVLNFVEKFFI